MASFPDKLSLPLLFILAKITLIFDFRIKLKRSVSLLYSTIKFSLKNYSVRVHNLTFTYTFSIFEFSYIDKPISCLKLSLSMNRVMLEFTFN